MKKIPAAVLGIVAALALALILSTPPHAFSSSGNAITGYAWSDNVGWVSLSGGTFGLSTDSSGNVTGYAWGDNVGWVSANPADTASCGAQAKLTSGSFTGWLRALNTGGDGCISLSGSGYQATTVNNSGYNNSTDYAWGSDAVGWLSVNASGGACTPTYVCSANQLVDTTCGQAPQACTYGCTNGATVCNSAPLPPTGCISVNSNTCSPAQKSVRVSHGSTVSLYWNVQNVTTSCTVTGTGGDTQTWTTLPTGGVVTSTVPATTAINSITNFNISCDGGTFSDQATVHMVPTVKEI